MAQHQLYHFEADGSYKHEQGGAEGKQEADEHVERVPCKLTPLVIKTASSTEVAVP
jgi:hypothetical protein